MRLRAYLLACASIPTMRHRPAFALLVAVALLASGCGSTEGSTTTVPSLVRAPPQTARLGWSEPYPAESPALVFGVSSFTVTRDGWRASVSMENRSDVAWTVGDERYPATLAFGVMLFPNDDLDELERRNRDGTLPAIRRATGYTPDLPSELRPGATWRGTISAPGALAGGLWIRLSFGPLVAVGDPPPGAAAEVVWFTDHAHELEEVVSEPA
jgi:hypothetical protein